jgi:hypothetical protein
MESRLVSPQNDEPRILWGPTLFTLAILIVAAVVVVMAIYTLPITAAALILIKLARTGRRR